MSNRYLIADALNDYRTDLTKELHSILGFWKSFVVDEEYGGFRGAVDHNNRPNPRADKGIVLNSRILWTFSAAARFGLADMDRFAARAYDYIREYFVDPVHGGVYWSVNYKGEVKESRKQVYGLAFCIYGLAEYYKISKEETALQLAHELVSRIETYSFDPDKQGYIEALSMDWKPLDDLRLSEKDANEIFSMNTHLHIIEAYANLYQVSKKEDLRSKILRLLQIFDQRIIDHQSGHLHLFMDADWNIRSDTFSFGHDIEASWLLQECALTADAPEYVEQFSHLAIRLARAASEGLAEDGAMYHETTGGSLLKEKHWWPQAEAMVGFFNAWQITGADVWLRRSLHTWDFVRENLKDSACGEWYWGLDETGSRMPEDKAGFWKCPYHNGRACMEILSRMDKVRL